MLAGVGLSAWLARRPLSRASVLRAALVVIGLVCIGGDGLMHSAGGKTPLGDLLFALAGCCWGLFGALSRRWHVDPLRVTSVVVVLSLLTFAPLFGCSPRHQASSGSPLPASRPCCCRSRPRDREPG